MKNRVEYIPLDFLNCIHDHCWCKSVKVTVAVIGAI